jgi:hypothetical protein
MVPPIRIRGLPRTVVSSPTRRPSHSSPSSEQATGVRRSARKATTRCFSAGAHLACRGGLTRSDWRDPDRRGCSGADAGGYVAVAGESGPPRAKYVVGGGAHGRCSWSVVVPGSGSVRSTASSSVLRPRSPRLPPTTSPTSSLLSRLCYSLMPALGKKVRGLPYPRACIIRGYGVVFHPGHVRTMPSRLGWEARFGRTLCLHQNNLR